MATGRSARLQARQQRVKDAVSPETSNYKDPSLFCLCLQPDDGRFMICCDQCNVWFHGDCVGIISAGEKRRAAKDDRQFVCPRCTPSVSSRVDIDCCPSSPTAFYPSTPCTGFQWGDKDGDTSCQLMRDVYETVVHWRRNSFLILSFKAGKGFVKELARLYQAYADNSALHSIAFTACCVFQVLLLQKPHAKSKSKEHVACLERHLLLWHNGDIPALLNEGKCIQDHLQSAIQSGTKP